MFKGGALDKVGLVGARCVERGGSTSLGLLAATGHGVRRAEQCPEREHGELEEEELVREVQWLPPVSIGIVVHLVPGAIGRARLT